MHAGVFRRFFEHHVEVRPAESKRTRCGAKRPFARIWFRLRLDTVGKGARREQACQVLVGLVIVCRGKQSPPFQGQDHFCQARCSRPALEVSHVGLDRTDRHRAWLDALGIEEHADRLDLRLVSCHSRSGMCFDHGDARRTHAGVLVCFAHGEKLPLGIGRGDALESGIGTGTSAENDCPDAVTVGKGVFETLEHEDRSSFSHDESVGPRIEGAGAVGGQGLGLAEFHVGRGAHVAVQPAGQDDVDLVGPQGSDRRCQGGQARSTGRVHGEVRAGQLECGSHTAGHHVGQFACHGVFGDIWILFAHFPVQLFEDLCLDRIVEVGESRLGHQDAAHCMGGDAARCQIAQVAAHGVSENDADPIFGQLCRIHAGVDKGSMGRIHGEDLSRVESFGHRRGDAPGPQVGFEFPEESADFAVGLVRCRGIWIVKNSWVPAVGWNFSDGIAPCREICDEFVFGVCSRQAERHAHYCDSIFSIHAVHRDPLVVRLRFVDVTCVLN